MSNHPIARQIDLLVRRGPQELQNLVPAVSYENAWFKHIIHEQ